MLKSLYSLDLSHNSINKIENLVGISSLVVLNLSMNELDDISYMPSMVSLKILNLNNNHVSINKLHTVRLQLLEFEETVKMCLSYRKFEPPKFRILTPQKLFMKTDF